MPQIVHPKEAIELAKKLSTLEKKADPIQWQMSDVVAALRQMEFEQDGKKRRYELEDIRELVFAQTKHLYSVSNLSKLAATAQMFPSVLREQVFELKATWYDCYEAYSLRQRTQRMARDFDLIDDAKKALEGEDAMYFLQQYLIAKEDIRTEGTEADVFSNDPNELAVERFTIKPIKKEKTEAATQGLKAKAKPLPDKFALMEAEYKPSKGWLARWNSVQSRIEDTVERLPNGGLALSIVVDEHGMPRTAGFEQFETEDAQKLAYAYLYWLVHLRISEREALSLLNSVARQHKALKADADLFSELAPQQPQVNIVYAGGTLS